MPLLDISWNLEVVVHGFERVVVAVEPDVAYACRRHETQDTLDHSQPGPKYRDEGQLLTRDSPPLCLLEWSLHRRWRKGEIAGCFVGHQHGDLFDEFLEDLCWGGTVAQDCELVLNQGVFGDGERREHRGSVHGREATIFARMKEYQVVVHRLTRHTQDDEVVLTDLLNERSRAGWDLATMAQDGQRLTLVFQRPGTGMGAGAEPGTD
jgi:hypothetical protein